MIEASQFKVTVKLIRPYLNERNYSNVEELTVYEATYCAIDINDLNRWLAAQGSLNTRFIRAVE